MPYDCTWRLQRPGIDQIGDCFFVDPGRFASCLSKHYFEKVAKERPPIAVCLSGPKTGWVFPFVIDSFPSSEPDAHWTVEVDLQTLIDGHKPLITVTPSIHAIGAYHGFLTAGVLTDDAGD